MSRRDEPRLCSDQGVACNAFDQAAELTEATFEETLAYYAFPEEHWRRIRTNNLLERIPREIRRRTRLVGAFPDGQSALNLAACSAAAHRRHRVVKQEISKYGAAEGRADERSHHRLSQYRAPLNPNQMCERVWTLPGVVSTREQLPARLRAKPSNAKFSCVQGAMPSSLIIKAHEGDEQHPEDDKAGMAWNALTKRAHSIGAPSQLIVLVIKPAPKAGRFLGYVGDELIVTSRQRFLDARRQVPAHSI